MNERKTESSEVPAAADSVRPNEAQTYVTFFVAEREYAVPAAAVNEVTQKAAATYLPNSSEYLLGIVPIRGEIAALIDLKKALGETPSRSERNKTLVLKPTGTLTMPMAFDIDRVGQLRKISHSEIRPAEADELGKVLAGISNADGSNLGLIDCRRLAGLLSNPA